MSSTDTPTANPSSDASYADMLDKPFFMGYSLKIWLIILLVVVLAYNFMYKPSQTQPTSAYYY